MKRPMTSYPCCLSKSAETEESTPPDMPTTTFFFLIMADILPYSRGNFKTMLKLHLPMLKKVYIFTFAILIVIGIAYFCESQTKGFRLQEILSDIRNNSRWEVAPL